MTQIKIKLLTDGKLPTQGTAGAAGWDMYARAHVVLFPGEIKIIGCGFMLELPSGWEAQVRSRSGLAAQHNVHVFNGPGTIDSDFRGECAAILRNVGRFPFTVSPGMRVAQMVFKRVPWVELVNVEHLDETQRGAGGYGSTGL